MIYPGMTGTDGMTEAMTEIVETTAAMTGIAATIVIAATTGTEETIAAMTEIVAMATVVMTGGTIAGMTVGMTVEMTGTTVMIVAVSGTAGMTGTAEITTGGTIGEVQRRR